jgi:hypothetical protein
MGSSYCLKQEKRERERPTVVSRSEVKTVRAIYKMCWQSLTKEMRQFGPKMLIVLGEEM